VPFKTVSAPLLYPWRGIQNISSRTIFCLTHDKRIFRLDEKNKKVFLKTAFCPLQMKVMSRGRNDMTVSAMSEQEGTIWKNRSIRRKCMVL
jgi:hypothetical protein